MARSGDCQRDAHWLIGMILKAAPERHCTAFAGLQAAYQTTATSSMLVSLHATHTHIYIYIYIYMCTCARVCVCMPAAWFLLSDRSRGKPRFLCCESSMRMLQCLPLAQAPGTQRVQREPPPTPSPCQILSCHVKSNHGHVISYHIISCHVISHHITSYQIISSAANQAV